VKPFDLLNAPLAGTHLIEASAGTGKTYTLEGLFLRLVLEEGMAPGAILVVTFTQAATDELKERIYRKLVTARRAFGGAAVEDELIVRLAAACSEPVQGRQMIRQAISEFDQAAIFTIHGFCQRVLYENAFETRTLFDTELIEDQTLLARRIAQDFWRNHLYEAPPEVIAHVTRHLYGPEALLPLLADGANPHLRILPRFAEKPTLEHLETFRRAAEDLRRLWPHARTNVQRSFSDPVLSGTVYGGLKPDPKTGGRSRRDRKVADLMAAMDGLACGGRILPPLFDDFEKFTSAVLQRAARRGKTPLRHPFFETCDALHDAASSLEKELDLHLAWLKTQAVAAFRSQLPARKRDLNVQSFDDLLNQVHQALTSEAGEALALAVRGKYQAVLIDEFQDTDGIQFEIFDRIFNRSGGVPLFFIGDPKQAIYGFRGADIFTYMQAARQSPLRCTLRQNWRSTQGLVAAVNAIFTNAPRPFLYDAIPFEAGLSANRQPETPGKPLTFWYLDARTHGIEGRPVAKRTAEPLIAAAVSGEIARLLREGPPGVEAGDVAVLVRTNRQARLMKHTLTNAGMPAVLHSTAPADARALRAALATRMWGKNAASLLAIDTDKDDWQSLQQRVLAYHRMWQDHGFMRMMRRLLADEDMAVRLIRLPDGERRLTNVRHLGEVLHQTACEQNLSMPSLVSWLAAQRDPSSPRLEAHQLRLESDAAAVRIVTIHKSKGLEYPVVFCPFAWQDSKVRGATLRFHDPEHAYRPTLHVNAGQEDACRRWAQNELLAENLRLLYVALTRAKSRCYVVWGRIRAAETSALAYLLHAGTEPSHGSMPVDAVGRLAEAMAAKTDEDYLADLEDLVARHPDCLAVEALPTTGTAYRPLPTPATEMNSRNFSGSIDRRRSIVSYSSLVAQPTAVADLPDHDEAATIFDSASPLNAAETEMEDGGPTDMFGFPKGARSGIFFHDILEQMDFAVDARAAREDLVTRKLAEYGFDGRWQDVVLQTLQQLLEIGLPAGTGDIRLCRLSAAQRVHEMEFYFPLDNTDPGALGRLLDPLHGRALHSSDGKRIADPTFNPPRGLMKGFIDLVFEHRDKYYVVDWKSNHLGTARADYHEERLREVMTEQLYNLQAMIYTLAVDQYLRLRRSDYSYQLHFGGVFYVFLRGVNLRWGPRYGVFASRAGADSLQALRDALIPGPDR